MNKTRMLAFASLVAIVPITLGVIWLEMPQIARGVEQPVISEANALELGQERARRSGLEELS